MQWVGRYFAPCQGWSRPPPVDGIGHFRVRGLSFDQDVFSTSQSKRKRGRDRPPSITQTAQPRQRERRREKPCASRHGRPHTHTPVTRSSPSGSRRPTSTRPTQTGSKQHRRGPRARTHSPLPPSAARPLPQSLPPPPSAAAAPSVGRPRLKTRPAPAPPLQVALGQVHLGRIGGGAPEPGRAVRHPALCRRRIHRHVLRHPGGRCVRDVVQPRVPDRQ